MSVLSYSFYFLPLKLLNKGMYFPFPPLKLPNKEMEDYSMSCSYFAVLWNKGWIWWHTRTIRRQRWWFCSRWRLLQLKFEISSAKLKASCLVSTCSFSFFPFSCFFLFMGLNVTTFSTLLCNLSYNISMLKI